MKLYGKRICLVCIFALLLLFFFEVNFSSAAFLNTDTQGLIQGHANNSAMFGGYEMTSDIYLLVQTVINAFLSLIGVILLAYLLYAGYKWMTAQGDEEKVTAAKETIYRAIIGIIIIVAAYAISIFVMSRLEAGTLRGGGGTTPPAVSPTPSPSPVDNGAEYYKTDGYAG